MFDAVPRLVLGLLTGIVFGFLLQKGRVAKFHVIVGQFLLREFTVLKVMLTAVAVGGPGVYAMKAMGLVSLHVKPLQVAAVLAGGALFGAAMAILGYCPGTAVAAAGEGSRHARFGLLGMFAGAAVYAECAGWCGRAIQSRGDFGTVTLPDAAGLPAWAVLAGVISMTLAVFAGVRRLERSIAR